MCLDIGIAADLESGAGITDRNQAGIVIGAGAESRLRRAFDGNRAAGQKAREGQRTGHARRGDDAVVAAIGIAGKAERCRAGIVLGQRQVVLVILLAAGGVAIAHAGVGQRPGGSHCALVGRLLQLTLPRVPLRHIHCGAGRTHQHRDADRHQQHSIAACVGLQIRHFASQVAEHFAPNWFCVSKPISEAGIRSLKVLG